jgi:hypothetical protein
MAESFIFYESFGKAIENLPPEKYKECMQALISYAINGEETQSDDPIVTMYLALTKPQVDANTTRRENGSKGGRPKNHRLSDEKPMVTESKTIGYETENHRLEDAKPNVNVNVNENVNVNGNEEGNPPTPFVISNLSAADLASLGCAPMVAEKLADWIANQSAKHQTITEMDLRSIVSRAKAATQKHGASAVAKVIEDSLQYKAIIWDRLETKARDKPKGWKVTQQTEYEDDLESRLLAN